MASLPENYIPYAPSEPVIRVIRRLRERGLPSPLNRKTLPTLGIAQGNSDRVQKALQFLGLIDDDGQRTGTFDRLGKASTDEYPGLLAEVIRAAYAPILTIVNPGDSDIAINDAFRPYEPSAQRSRMVSLFNGLCREAGLVSGGPIQRQPKAKQGASPAKSAPKPPRVDATTPRVEPKVAEPEAHDGHGLDLRLVSGLIQQLPREGRWTAARRDRWIQAMTATVDLLIELDEGVVP